jgi:hypothetical protein
LGEAARTGRNQWSAFQQCFCISEAARITDRSARAAKDREPSTQKHSTSACLNAQRQVASTSSPRSDNASERKAPLSEASVQKKIFLMLHRQISVNRLPKFL